MYVIRVRAVISFMLLLLLYEQKQKINSIQFQKLLVKVRDRVINHPIIF